MALHSIARSASAVDDPVLGGLSMKQVQGVASVVHEVDALAGNIDQPEQGSRTGRIAGVVEQRLEYMVCHADWSRPDSRRRHSL